MVTEIKEGGRRVESEKKVFPGYVLVRMELDDRSWLRFATPLVLRVLSVVMVSPLRSRAMSTTRS